MRILILINNDVGLYKFRKELIETMISAKHDVYISLPNGEYVQTMVDAGCNFIDTPIDRRGMSVRNDISLFFQYIRILRSVRPDMVLTYTIKPNIYGAAACRILGVKNINTVTGLGSVYIQNLKFKKLISFANRFSFGKSLVTFFLNQDNKMFYIDNKIIMPNQKTRVVHGSGVNIESFLYSELESKPDEFIFIGRIFKDKGIGEYIEAARMIKKTHSDCIFHIVGMYEEEVYKSIIDSAVEDNVVIFHGKQNDVRPFIKTATCLVLPSYGEGCGTVLQEAAAIGRPLIACDTYGCRDNVIDGYNGYLCKVADAESLQQSMMKLISLDYKEKIEMGKRSRSKAEKEFDRMRIINSYMEEIGRIENELIRKDSK